jgi:outer membrane protein OmpA-like peptidoglycan-associated protein
MSLTSMKARSTTGTHDSAAGWRLQRQCACGTHTPAGGECESCKKQRGNVQTQLRVGDAYDRYEQEADHVADQVLSTSAHTQVSYTPPRVQRFTASESSGAVSAPASVDRVLASAGQPLDASFRREVEPRFGADFSRVRVHSDATAAQSARDIQANAYTVGSHIVFDSGNYVPRSSTGRRLLAHELTHVLQQQPSALQRVQRSPKSSTLDLTIGAVDSKSSDPNCQYDKGEAEKSRTPNGILPNDIEQAEFFQMEPQDAVVIADFPVDGGGLRPSTAALFRKFWAYRFSKADSKSFEIVGYSDCVGWESRNSSLRSARTQAVASLLPGIDAHAGPENEYPSSATGPEGRALNRSVMIRKKAPPPKPVPVPKPHEIDITPEHPATSECTPDESKQLGVGFAAAKIMAQRARAAVRAQDKSDSTRFLLQRYFGDKALWRENLEEIAAGYSKILDNWKNWDYGAACETADQETCKGDDPHRIILAFVNVKGHVFARDEPSGAVHVCPAAFTKLGPQEFASAVLHELSHRLDNTDDRKYCGFSGEGKCADLSTEKAIDNADSYAQFARDIFNLSL